MAPAAAMAGCMMKYRCSTSIWTAIDGGTLVTFACCAVAAAGWGCLEVEPERCG